MAVICTVLCLLSYIFASIVFGCFLLLLCFVAYIHYVHKINDHLPGPPRSSFLFGHASNIKKYQASTGRTIEEFFLERRLEYGPIFVLFVLHRAMVFLGDSDYIRHVFINNHKNLYKNAFIYHKLGFVFGERGGGYGLITNTNETLWRKRRQLINPAFHRRCLKDFIGNFNAVCDRFLSQMDKVVDIGKPTSMVKQFSKISLEVISKVSFNMDTGAIEDPTSPFPAAVRQYLRGVQASLDIPFANSTVLSIFQLKIFQNAAKKEQIEATEFLRKYASDCTLTRMKEIADGEVVPDDLLSLLIKDGSLSLDEIIDEFLTIFLAGQETTANSLSFTLYEIIRNPHVELKLLNEVNEVLGDHDFVSFNDLAKLKYLGQVFDESLRKYQIAGAPGRILAKDITVGGYQIPKGDEVFTRPIFFGRNPEIWKDPDVFDPERFSNPENIPNFSTTHFPFSLGPRNCIGQTFAKFESKVVLARLLRRFQFSLLPGQTGRMQQNVSSSPRDGVMCLVSKRE